KPDFSMTALRDAEDQYSILGEDGYLIKFRLIFNDRFVFGTGPSAPVLGFFLTFFAIIFLFFYRWHNYNLGHPLSWLFVFSGAAGNLIDKMFVKSLTTRDWTLSIFPKPGHINGVVDFIECIWFGWGAAADIPLLGFLAWDTWPSFNIADSLIVVGITLMLFTMNPAAETAKEK
ncbi:MAG: signal peptidase II, partial [Spirochaetia bacterium]|nr:signal peptidase II [Spirochaetia bacterium]